MITRADLLGDALREEASALAPFMPSEADGWGAGFYQAGEVLHRKRPQAVREPTSFAVVLDDIRSQLAIAHVREATVGDGRADNTQPFRMRQWLFAHVGSLVGHETYREKLERALPDFLRRNMRGQTDSELLFHLVMSFLHESGHIDSVDVPHSAVLSALRGAAALVDKHATEAGAGQACLTLALTNGRQLYAMQRGLPLALLERTGLPRRGSDRPGERRTDHEVRYALIASSAPTSGVEAALPEGYRPLADREVICIERELQVTSATL